MISVQILADTGIDPSDAIKSVIGRGCEAVVGYLPGRKPSLADHSAVVAVEVERGPRDLNRKALTLAATHDALAILEPWEAIVSGWEALERSVIEGKTTRVMVVNGDVVIKPVRAWRRGAAEPCQAVMDCVLPDTDATLVDCVIDASEQPSQCEWMTIAERWARDNPLLPAPDYCLACLYLGAGDFDSFWTRSEAFLFKAKVPSMATVMIRYQRALVAGLTRHQPREAIANLAHCIAARPCMAEFWCLLGDVFVASSRSDIAVEHYRNAIAFGKSRDFGDPWPIDISKYEAYPREAMKVNGPPDQSEN